MDQIVVDALPPPSVSQEDWMRAANEALQSDRDRLALRWERRRRTIERALHDGAQQHLLAMRIDLVRVARAADRLHDFSTGSVVIDVAEVCRRFDATIDELQRLSQGHGPGAVHDHDLAATLKAMSEGTPLSLSINVNEPLHVEDLHAELLIFVASECMANGLKYAPETPLTISARDTGGGTELHIADQGNGGVVFRSGHGLDSLRMRSEALGGHLTLDSNSNGTTITTWLPHTTTSIDSAAATAHHLVQNAATMLQVRKPIVDLEALLRSSANDPFLTVQVIRTDTDEPGDVSESGNLVGTSNNLPTKVELVVRSSSQHSATLNSHTHNSHTQDSQTRNSQTHDSQLVATITSGAAVPAIHEAVLTVLHEVANAVEFAKVQGRLKRLQREHEAIERRAIALEEHVGRRLAERPIDELREARAIVLSAEKVSANPQLLHRAAELVENATTLLRRIVSDLRESDDPTDQINNGSLLDDIHFLGKRHGWDVAANVDDGIDQRARVLLANLIEEVFADLFKNQRSLEEQPVLRVLVRKKSERITMRADLPRLPQPVNVALMNSFLEPIGGAMSFDSNANGIRMEVTVPCQ
jgi:anti-sigma regulatory factor (Ser/Thr protein kinase)